MSELLHTLIFNAQDAKHRGWILENNKLVPPASWDQDNNTYEKVDGIEVPTTFFDFYNDTNPEKAAYYAEIVLCYRKNKAKAIEDGWCVDCGYFIAPADHESNTNSWNRTYIYDYKDNIKIPHFFNRFYL
jgi:hypothetical protein